MGTVYLAEHKLLHHKVAIKALNPKLCAAPDMRERFEREAHVLARLSHPAITRILNFYRLPDGFFIVTEYDEGQTLEERLEATGPIPWREGVRWMVDVLRGLSNAHANSIIHRNIKPSNIRIAADGRAKILDFGFSRVSDGVTLTVQGLTLGTMYYMSREQLFGKSLDARSDIYSVGATLYELLSGKLPFYDENEQKLVVMIAKQEAPALSSLVPDIPTALEKVVAKAMSKDPAQRYATAEDMAVALERCLAPADAAPAEPTPPKAAGIPTPAPRSSAPPPPAPPAPPPPAPPPPPPRATTERRAPVVEPDPNALPEPVAVPSPSAMAKAALVAPLRMGHSALPASDLPPAGAVPPPPRPAPAPAPPPPSAPEAFEVVDAPPPPPPPAAPAKPASPRSRLSPLLIVGACVTAGTLGLGIALLVGLESQKLWGAVVLGAGLPVGLVLLALGVLSQGTPDE